LSGSAIVRHLEKRKNVAEESGQSDKPPEPSEQSDKPPEQPAKKRQKVPLEVQEQRLAPKPSMWPIILALALVVAFVGIMTNPIILTTGVILTIAAIIGWTLEKH
jgi:Cytochrome c oxidase subunit IV